MSSLLAMSKDRDAIVMFDLVLKSVVLSILSNVRGGTSTVIVEGSVDFSSCLRMIRSTILLMVSSRLIGR